MPDAPHGARVPRAVAGVPPPVLADGEAVAKAWLLELVAAAPLERAATVPVAALAARGPALCAALLEAVGSAAGRDAPLGIGLAGAEEPWREAIEGALDAHGRDGAPFAVLAVEVADAERLLAAGGRDAAALVAFERGVRAAVRPGDAVVRER